MEMLYQLSYPSKIENLRARLIVARRTMIAVGRAALGARVLPGEPQGHSEEKKLRQRRHQHHAQVRERAEKDKIDGRRQGVGADPEDLLPPERRAQGPR